MCSNIKSTGSASIPNNQKISVAKKTEIKPEPAVQEKETANHPEEKVFIGKSVNQGKAASSIEMVETPPANTYKNASFRTVGVLGNMAVQGLLYKGINPTGSTIGGIFITVFDVSDANKKTNDPNVSKTSAALAWMTVGLDGINVATGMTGSKLISLPISWAIEGTAIATSWLSDVTANQSVAESVNKSKLK